MRAREAAIWIFKLKLIYFHVVKKGHGKDIVKAMATKFLGNFAIIMLKMHTKNCGCGLTHLDATPTFLNRSDTYG